MHWYLNDFLTSWRAAIDDAYPQRSKASDGTIGDTRHQAESFSEHNPDRDGSVDAWDMDVNLRGSKSSTGSKTERADIEDLKAAFQNQKAAQLWIHNGQIANKDVGNWKRRAYHGANAHKHHVHWQSDPDYEKRTFSGDLGDDDDIVLVAFNEPDRLSAAKVVPNWPTGAPDYIKATSGPSNTILRAQTRLKERGWKITRDGVYGPQSERIVRLFQKEKWLKTDGVLGPVTWRAMWALPIT